MQVTTRAIEVGTSIGHLKVLHLIALGRGNFKFTVRFRVQKVQFQGGTIGINGIDDDCLTLGSRPYCPDAPRPYMTGPLCPII